MYQEAFTCDVCGTVRKETNKWFLAHCVFSIVISPFDSEEAKHKDWTHLCGESCTQKFVSANLASLHSTTEPQSVSTLPKETLAQLIKEQELDEAEDVTHTYRVDAELKNAEEWKEIKE